MEFISDEAGRFEAFLTAIHLGNPVHSRRIPTHAHAMATNVCGMVLHGCDIRGVIALTITLQPGPPFPDISQSVSSKNRVFLVHQQAPNVHGEQPTTGPCPPNPPPTPPCETPNQQSAHRPRLSGVASPRGSKPTSPIILPSSGFG